MCAKIIKVLKTESKYLNIYQKSSFLLRFLHFLNKYVSFSEDYRNEYISLTDIARFRNSDDPRFAIQNWMRNRNTIEFLGLWESLHNPNFNRVQFDTFKGSGDRFMILVFLVNFSILWEGIEFIK